MEDTRQGTVPMWTVSRRVGVATPQAQATDVSRRIVAADVECLSIGSPTPIFAGHAFEAELTVPGFIDVKVPVVLKAVPFAPNAVAVSLHVSGRFPRFGLSAPRYFKAAWSVIDELARALDTEGPETFDEAELAA
jgi:hypothetical protein